MPVPKRKLSRRRRDKRSANKGIKPKQITLCQTCSFPMMPHQICKDCGYYKGTKILRTRLERMEIRGKSRKEQQEKRQARLALAGGQQAEQVAAPQESQG